MPLPDTLAICTTIYPGVEPFLGDWFRSVQQQTDRSAQLWIAVDALEIDAVIDLFGSDPCANWVRAEQGDSPAMIRQRLLERAAACCDAVVLVDSDDILCPERVAAARTQLHHSDLAGCGLRLVDAQGEDMDGASLRLPPAVTPASVLPRHNVFGLSNTAWRTEALQRCLPIPAAVEIVDWFLATRAWLCGFRLDFENVDRMAYRRHGNNMVHVQGPFSKEQVVRDTERVLRHFYLVGQAPLDGALATRKKQLNEVAADVVRFRATVMADEGRLRRYVEALNDLHPEPLWWSCVAHPALHSFWS